MNNSVEDIVINTINSIPVEITDGEAALFNSLPADEVVSALQKLIFNEPGQTIASRAFDALLKMEEFDKVTFLINLADEYPQRWRIPCYRNLARFQDRRAIEKLCDVIKSDNDPDVRYVAAESLAVIGDETAIAVLEYVAAYDDGKDWEGFRVADMVGEAKRKIEAKFRGEV